jgi:hypothetical protein
MNRTSFSAFFHAVAAGRFGYRGTAVLKEQQHMVTSSLDPPHLKPLFRDLGTHVPLRIMTATITRLLDEVDGQLGEDPPRSGLRHNWPGGLG